jgi:hypothetical protein
MARAIERFRWTGTSPGKKKTSSRTDALIQDRGDGNDEQKSAVDAYSNFSFSWA